MLELLKVYSVEQKFSLLDNLSVDSTQWVVADLKSKMFLRQRLHRKFELLSDDCVLRANDLWASWLQRMQPELKQVPDETIELIVLNELKKINVGDDGGAIHLESLAEHLRDYIDQLVNLLNHPSSDQILADFFKEDTGAHARWGKWFELSRQIWPQLEKLEVFSSRWAAPLLLEQDWQQLVPQGKRFIFDLGFQLDQVELELIEKISAIVDVTLIEPVHQGQRQRCYQTAEAAAVRVIDDSVTEQETNLLPAENVQRMTTPLAEIKDTVAKIRVELEAGRELKDMAITVGSLEEYWPVLSSYLKTEGIPFKKHLTVRLVTMPALQIWLSKLRAASKPNRFSDLEQSHFNHYEKPSQPFHKFRYLFEKMCDEADLKQFALDRQIDINQKISKIEFLKWAVDHFPTQGKVEHLEEALVCYFSQTPAPFVMTGQQHLLLFEKLLSRREITVEEGRDDGIEVIPIFTMEYLPATMVFLLGLDSQAMRPGQKTQISLNDASQLAAKTGFHIPHCEQIDVGLELGWLDQTQGRYTVKYFSESSFSGTAQTPSLYWLIAAHKSDSLTMKIPGLSRWDELHRVGLEKLGTINQWSESRSNSLVRRISQDLGEIESDLFPPQKMRYSSSTIENYYRCPFLVAARKVFRLDDEASIDIDLDAAKQGRLMHKIFEVLKEKPQASVEDAVEEAYLQILGSKNRLIQDERIWGVVKKRYSQVADQFLTMEKEFFHQHPSWKMLQGEVEILKYFDPESMRFTDSETEYPFIAFVDRIDQDESGNLFVLDYKSSSGRLSHHPQWIKESSIQLPVYSMLAELEFDKEVVGATYYVAKDGRRDMGFILDSESSMDDQRSRFNKVSRDQKEEIMTSTRELIGQAIENISSGQLSVKPAEPNDCYSCRWRKLCRAPHLN